jgi:hypothetical protein
MAGLSAFPYRGPSSSREWACESGFCRFPDFGLYRSGTADRRVTPPFPLDYFLRHPGHPADRSEPVLAGWFFPSSALPGGRLIPESLQQAAGDRPATRAWREILLIRGPARGDHEGNASPLDCGPLQKATAVFLGDAGAARLVCGNLFTGVRLNLQQKHQNAERLSAKVWSQKSWSPMGWNQPQVDRLTRACVPAFPPSRCQHSCRFDENSPIARVACLFRGLSP